MDTTAIIVAIIAGFMGGFLPAWINRKQVEANVAQKWQEMLNAEVEARKKLEVEVTKLRRGVEKLIRQIEKEGLCPDWRPEDG